MAGFEPQAFLPHFLCADHKTTSLKYLAMVGLYVLFFYLFDFFTFLLLSIFYLRQSHFINFHLNFYFFKSLFIKFPFTLSLSLFRCNHLI